MDLVERLKQTSEKRFFEIDPTRLYTHNIDVDTINQKELSAVKGKEVVYTMSDRGNDKYVESLKKSCLAPEALHLKVGARVMCVKNNFEQGYANGTLGVVVSCANGVDPVIRVSSGKEIKIERASWQILDDSSAKVKAEIIQYPLRLAWAITIHKSQGMSLDAIEVDLSRSFEKGMGYVALSRVRSLEGLNLVGINENALQVSSEVAKFNKDLMQASENAELAFEATDPEMITKVQDAFMSYAPHTI
jgi:ATP-dependent exoDNAse (exonuclease V) alpha subunit